VKLGEWKLGYELEHEEPLPFQIINVQTIKYHPGYVDGSTSNDTAMLFLEHPATFNLHINTLCLPDNYQVPEISRCIVTGWGKSILQGIVFHRSKKESCYAIKILDQEIGLNKCTNATV